MPDSPQPNAVQAAKSAAPAKPEPRQPLSLLLRRIHMFAGLFLGPWMLMYALSTLMMTHREYVASFYTTKAPAMVTEHELDYTRSFPADVKREEMGKQILADLGLEGRYYVSGARNGKPLVINRQHALRARRITFDPAAGRITIQRQEFRALNFLEQMHRRRGYDQPYAKEDTWGFSVDLAVVTMIFWSLSGVWLWWEIKPVRKWGAVSLAGGLGLFALMVFLL